MSPPLGVLPSLLGLLLLMRDVSASMPCGTSAHRILVGNTTRDFLAHTPAAACNSNISRAASAVLVCLHGWRQDSSWACSAMCTPYAEAHGFVALCPQGLTDQYANTGWNTHDGSGWSAHDDMSFVRAMISYAHTQAVVPNVTYVTGFSMGGGLSYRMMCEASDIISGFSVVAQPGPWGGAGADATAYGAAEGASWARNCTPAVKRPFWAGIGLQDGTFDAASARVGWENYSRAILGCSGSPAVVKQRGSVACHRFSGCPGFASDSPASEFCSYDNLPHRYTSTPGELAGLAVTQATSHDSTPAAWAFWTNGVTIDPPSAPPPSAPLPAPPPLYPPSPSSPPLPSSPPDASLLPLGSQHTLHTSSL